MKNKQVLKKENDEWMEQTISWKVQTLFSDVFSTRGEISHNTFYTQVSYRTRQICSSGWVWCYSKCTGSSWHTRICSMLILHHHQLLHCIGSRHHQTADWNEPHSKQVHFFRSASALRKVFHTEHRQNVQHAIVYPWQWQLSPQSVVCMPHK